MKKISTLFSMLFLSLYASAQFCNMNGNLIIYSNYDGGTLTINIDQNIPNLKVGIISYEAVSVTFTGAFVGNITAVEWAGYNANNGHCTPNVPTTVINGVSSSIVTQSVLPTATYSDPNGYSSIVCAYSCGSGNQGGCNTAIQIADYFINSLGGTLYYHYLQYGCWNGTMNVSTGGNCCDQPTQNNPPVAGFTVPAANFCMNDCISFADNSINTPTSWSWTFNGGNPSTSTLQNPTICYNTPGTYTVSLTATNAFGSDTYASTVTINSVNASVTQNGTMLTAISSGANYIWIDCNTNTAVSGETQQNFTPSVSGDYALVITENGCTDTSGCLNVTVNSLQKLNFENFASVFPNPNQGDFKIKISDLRLKGAPFVIENMIGEIVYQSTIQQSEQNLNLSVASGYYFLKINSPLGFLVTKISIQ